MQKKGKNRQRKKPPDDPQTNMRLQPALVERGHALHEAYKRTTGQKHAPLNDTWNFLVGYAEEHCDPNTGRPKPVRMLVQPPPSPVLIIPPDLPLFQHSTDIDRFVSNAELSAAMDASGMMLWAAAPHNNCVHVTPRLVEYTGIAAEDFYALGWAGVVHPDDRAATMKTCVEGFGTHKPFRITYRMRRKDGSYGWILDHAHPRHNANGRFLGYIGTMYEVAVPGQKTEVLVFEDGVLRIEERVTIPDPERTGAPGWIAWETHRLPIPACARTR